MLVNISISNVALIEEATFDFTKGLNIMSGETGSGKSMIIDSMNFILGGKVSKDFIRTGATTAEVQLTILVDNENNKKNLEDNGIVLDEDNLLIFTRVYNSSGKSSIRLNGKIITLGMVREIAPYFIDFHGQHDNQSLLNEKKHILLLDKFCNLDEKKQTLAELLKNYRLTRTKLTELEQNTKDSKEKLDLYTFQSKEIETAKLVNGEEETLNKQKEKLLSLEKIINNTNSGFSMLSGNESSDNIEMNCVTELLSKSIFLFREIENTDEKIKEACEKLEQISILTADVIGDISSFRDTIENFEDEMSLDQIEERLHMIYTMKKKYGEIDEILEYYDEIQNKLSEMENFENNIHEINAEKNKLAKEVIKICGEISSIRKETAKKLEKDIENALADLGMKNSTFKIDITKTEEFSLNGFDKVAFLISPNAGEDVKPLSKIASGGEMSRVMLALKSIIASADDVETFIFDEIDTGISGRTAQSVAEKLVILSNIQQIVAITHLPQIAAMSDNHIYIEKTTDNVENKTTTNVKVLNNEEIITELARLLGGAEITNSTMKASEEMKVLANDKKKEILKN